MGQPTPHFLHNGMHGMHVCVDTMKKRLDIIATADGLVVSEPCIVQCGSTCPERGEGEEKYSPFKVCDTLCT